MIAAVNILGEGNAQPGFVGGAECAQPYGFKNWRDGLKSNLESFEFLMPHGILPRILHWNVTPLAQLGAQRPPLLEYYLELNRSWYDTWKSYRLPVPVGLGRISELNL